MGKYQVATIERPHDWDPRGPLDLPDQPPEIKASFADKALTFSQAVATVRSLNRQVIDRTGTTWYVIVALENEPVGRTAPCHSAESESAAEHQPYHVVRLEESGGQDT